MKKISGVICGVCSTLANLIGINPWILRILAIIFFNNVFPTYIGLAIIFALILDDEEEECVEKEEKKKKRKEKTQKKLTESKTDYIKKEDFQKKEYSERPNGNLIKND